MKFPVKAPSKSNNKPITLPMLASFACVIHCVLTPILVIYTPLLGNFFHNHFLEVGLFIFSILIGTLTIRNGYCKHKQRFSIILYSVGSLFWIAHLMSELLFHSHVSFPFLTLGTLFIIWSYFINHRDLKKCLADNSCCS